MSLADHPRVMLPIIFYNLVQHLIAGLVDRLVCGRPERGTPPVAVRHAGRVLVGPGSAGAVCSNAVR